MGGEADHQPGAARVSRAALRRAWREAGWPWAAVPPRIGPRNVAIARAYLETAELVVAIAARHGITPQRVLLIVHNVLHATLGRHAPRGRG